jgi:LmbE family N-acetylglucosaminyl deacetylase
MLEFKRILVFASHSDDEIIGPGGTIARLSRNGAEIVVVTFTGGETSYQKGQRPEEMLRQRQKEAQECDRVLGISRRIMLGKPTQGVTNDRETYQECVGIIRQVRPEAIFTHYREDKHRDHRHVSEITDEARWKASENVLGDMGASWYTPHLYFYEVTELFTHPSLVVDITDTLERKLEAMRTQASQMAVLPGIVDYIEGLARVRGYMCGTRYGEAFLESTLIPTLL